MIGRILLAAYRMRTMKARYPEMFDGARARESVEACVTEYEQARERALINTEQI